MADSATARIGLRQQSQGSNVTTWGDDKLNEALRIIDRATKGFQSLAITGDTTLSWTNYIATNDGQVAWLTLTGSLSAAASLTVPSVQWTWQGIKNSTGQTVTVKTSAGSGIAIPDGRQIAVYCDGTDCYNGAPMVVPGALTVAGIISGLTAGVASTDAVNKTQMETAIATATLPATAGTILNSSSDTTAGYLGQKTSGSKALTASTTSPAGNEVRNFSVEYGALIAGATQTTGFTAVSNTRYLVNLAASGTITLPAAPTAGDIIEYAVSGGFPLTLNPNGLKINGGTANLVIGTDEETRRLTYTGATRGWV